MNDLMTVEKLDAMMKWAEAYSQSNLVPDAYRGKPNNVIVALQMGEELGLKPMQSLKNLYVVNGMPSMSADCKIGLCMTSKDFVDLKYTITEEKATVTITRKINGKDVVFESSFSMEDAKRAGLFNEKSVNWRKYPKDMMMARAKSRCSSLAFPDIMMGLYTPDEITSGAVIEDDFMHREEISTEDAVKQATENFKLNNNEEEEAVYEVVEPEKESESKQSDEFFFTEKQKEILGQDTIKKITGVFKSAYSKMTRYENEFESIDNLVSTFIPKDYSEYDKEDFRKLYKVLTVVDKGVNFDEKMVKEFDEYYRGEK